MKKSIYKFVLASLAVAVVFGANINVLALPKAPSLFSYPGRMLSLSSGEIHDFIDKINENRGSSHLNIGSWSLPQIQMNGSDFKGVDFKELIASYFITQKDRYSPVYHRAGMKLFQGESNDRKELSNSVSVPEPSYMILSGIFLLVLLAFQRKRFLK